MYRPPWDSNLEEWLLHTEDTLGLAGSERKQLVLMGDLNSDLLEDTS